LRVRKRAQKQTVRQTEDERGGADAKRENQNCCCGDREILAKDAKGVAEIVDDHVIVLPWRLIKNSEDGVKPDRQEADERALFTPAVHKGEAEFAVVFVAKLGRVKPEKRLIEAKNAGLRFGGTGHGLGSFANQAGGASIGEQFLQMAGLFHGGAFTGFGEAVVAAALVVVFRIGALFETLFEEAFDGAVERAGAEPNLAAGAFGDFLHDGIAVAVAVGERDENVESVTGKKERAHGETISGFAIADKGVFAASWQASKPRIATNGRQFHTRPRAGKASNAFFREKEVRGSMLR
jgi:hypothetical protein